MQDAICRCGRGHGFRITRRKGLAALLGAGLAGAFAGAPEGASAGAPASTPPQPEDEGFMRLAIAEAAKGDFPFGAVIVRDGGAIATGRNLGKSNDDPTAHAEMIALRQLITAGATGKLKGATLYASGEPCPMCMGAIIWCGIGRVVFAASMRRTRDEDRPDHGDERAARRGDAIYNHSDHRRRAGGGIAGAVQGVRKMSGAFPERFNSMPQWSVPCRRGGSEPFGA